MIQRVNPEITEENTLSREGAARGAAVGAENAHIAPDLQSVIERWPELSEAVKASIVAMVVAGDE